MRLNEQRHRVDRWSGPCISMLGCAFRAHSRPWAFSVRNEGDEEERRDVKEGMLNAECRSRGSPYTCSTPKPPRSNSPGKRQILFLLSLFISEQRQRENRFSSWKRELCISYFTRRNVSAAFWIEERKTRNRFSIKNEHWTISIYALVLFYHTFFQRNRTWASYIYIYNIRKIKNDLNPIIHET